VLNGILWRFRSGAPWAEVPERYGPSTTCYNRFIRWRKAGVWDRLLAAVSAGFNGELVMIDSTCMRVYQHGAKGKKGDPAIMAWDVPGAALRPNSMLLSTLMNVLSACN
jgi:transposase